MTDDYNVLRESVLEYAPVALNEIIEHFASVTDEPARLRRLGNLATNFVLESPYGSPPNELTSELREAIEVSAIALASFSPDEAELMIGQAFDMADELAVRRAAASGVRPDVVRAFSFVMRNLERLVQDAVKQTLIRNEPVPDGL